MNQTITLQDDIAKKAENVLKAHGLTPEQAITLFFEQIALQQKLPFSFNQPNEETLQAFKDSEQGINCVECDNADDLFEKLGI